MNTRYKKSPGPLSQERYMSSNEYSELRGISGIAVSARTAVLVSDKKSSLLWFIQGLSLQDGGLRRVATELVEMFPNRIGTPEMHTHKITSAKTCPGQLVDAVERTLQRKTSLPDFKDRQTNPQRGETLLRWCVEAALRRPSSFDDRYCQRKPLPSIEEFLIDLCINPRIQFSEPGENASHAAIESELTARENPDLAAHEFREAGLVYFRDIVAALFEYQARHENRVLENFQVTTISKIIWGTLDFALSSDGMVLLDGLEGRGKTEAVKAWCNLHLGRARFVSLKGITTKTTAFREIARALGIASSYTRTAPEMQARIEDVLKRSKIMLCVDEAHFVFNQGRRMYSRPELVDWIDTAVCNRGVPIALVTTPQFLICMTRAADQVEWNYRQFRRRVRRWVKLPNNNTEEDIRAVARHVFKNASAAVISKIVGYALLCKRDLSAVGDVVAEVRAMLGTKDLSSASPDQVQSAIKDYLMPSDETFLEGMEAVRSKGRKPLPRPAMVAPGSRQIGQRDPRVATQQRHSDSAFVGLDRETKPPSLIEA